MRWKVRGVSAVCLSVFAAAVLSARVCAWQVNEPKMSGLDRERAELMLRNIHETLKKNYYDPAFHGLDVGRELRAIRGFTQKSEDAERGVGDDFCLSRKIARRAYVFRAADRSRASGLWISIRIHRQAVRGYKRSFRVRRVAEAASRR